MKVTYVQLHDGFFCPGLGNMSQMQKTLDAGHYPGLVMDYTKETINCSFRGVSFSIPVVNAKVFITQGEVREVAPQLVANKKH